MAVIRPAQLTDLPALPEIEQQAAQLFAPFGLYELFARHTTAPAEFAAYQQAGHLWVAIEDNRPVGFIIASVMGDDAYINEVDVLPPYGQRGIGRALIETVCQWAQAQKLTGISLSTQSNIPWNAPFYARLGFHVVSESEWAAYYHDLRAHEISLGLPVADRVFMRRVLE